MPGYSSASYDSDGGYSDDVEHYVQRGQKHKHRVYQISSSSSPLSDESCYLDQSEDPNPLREGQDDDDEGEEDDDENDEEEDEEDVKPALKHHDANAIDADANSTANKSTTQGRSAVKRQASETPLPRPQEDVKPSIVGNGVKRNKITIGDDEGRDGHAAHDHHDHEDHDHDHDDSADASSGKVVTGKAVTVNDDESHAATDTNAAPLPSPAANVETSTKMTIAEVTSTASAGPLSATSTSTSRSVTTTKTSAADIITTTEVTTTITTTTKTTITRNDVLAKDVQQTSN